MRSPIDLAKPVAKAAHPEHDTGCAEVHDYRRLPGEALLARLKENA